MDIIEFTTKINGIKIFVKMLDSTTNNKMPEPDKINDRVNKEFNTDYDFKTNARRILNELRPHCFEVSITPPVQGFTYSYSIIAKK